jgi:hypothetical protein|nr:MAG TPA: hypothetical protein [Caudoviricetes sp.]
MSTRMIRLTKTNKKWTKNHKIVEVLFQTIIFDNKGHELKDKELSPRDEFTLSFEIKNNKFVSSELREEKSYSSTRMREWLNRDQIRKEVALMLNTKDRKLAGFEFSESLQGCIEIIQAYSDFIMK